MLRVSVFCKACGFKLNTLQPRSLRGAVLRTTPKFRYHALILRVAILSPRIGRLRFGAEFWIEQLAGGFGAYCR